MPAYDYERLSDILFEHLGVALAQHHVARGVAIYGAGRDGGREGTYEGRMDYPSLADSWQGYLVLQCKHKSERGATKKVEGDWAIAQLDREMEAYVSGKTPRRRPEYYLFITNAELSAVPETGGKDRFMRRLAYWIDALGMRAADVWDREKLDRLLDAAQPVAQRFGLLHAGDLLHHLGERALAELRSADATLSLYLQEELRADHFVRLSQAGHVEEEGTPLARVFVDLKAKRRPPHTGAEPQVYVVQSIQGATDRPLPPSLSPTGNRVLDSPLSLIGRFTLVGGPGQGKSTLTQHLAQRHRAALLQQRPAHSIPEPIRRLLDAIEAEASTSEHGLPCHPRIPFRVVLERFAGVLASGEAVSVLDYLALLVRVRTSRPFTSEDAEALLAEAPLLVAFDGLDEVPATSNRADVMDAVRTFLSVAQALDADLAVIATTRPQGYDNEFSPDYFAHLHLLPLSPEDALSYAEQFSNVRYEADPDRRDRVLGRLQQAVQEPATARLMTSPLQVTIMAALVDLVGTPPRERYALFDRYYDVVYQREQERGLHASEVLAEHRADIDALHDRIGLLLQVETEGDPRSAHALETASGRLTDDDLRRLVSDRLRSEGYEGDDLEDRTDQIVQVALHRLVFIVPREEGRYGFEVRSLQEFAAARALMRGPYDQIKERLLAVSPTSYWRNVALFAFGKMFVDREDLRDLIATVCSTLDQAEAERGRPALMLGARIALDVIENGVVDQKPLFRNALIDRALHLLHLADPDAARRLAALYRPDHDQHRFEDAIQAADPLAACVVLAALDANDVTWAHDRLLDVWPEDPADARAVYAHLASDLVWRPETVAHAENLARESWPGWVSDTLSPHVPSDWVADAAALDSGHRPSTSVYLASPPVPPRERLRVDATFHFGVVTPLADPSPLDRIAAAMPTHPGWAAAVAARPWISAPSAASLADALDALAEADVPPQRIVPWSIGWPFVAVAANADSDSLREAARHARDGAFGDVEDWYAAEARWADVGLSPADWSCGEAPFPLTPGLRECGFAPLHAVSFRSGGPRSDFSGTERPLLDAFAATSDPDHRRDLAEALLFHFSVGTQERAATRLSYALPIRTLVEIAEAAREWNHAGTLAALIRPEDALPENSDALDKLGRACRLAPASNRDPARDAVLATTRDALAGLAGPDRPGIARLIAGLVLLGAAPPQPDLDNAPSLASWILNLFRGPADPTPLVDIAAGLLADAPDDEFSIPDVLQIIQLITETSAPAPHSFVSRIARDARFPLETRAVAVRAVRQAALRVKSGLADPEIRAGLGLMVTV